MPLAATDRVIRLLSHVSRHAPAQSDGHLLRRFVRDRDDDAFEALLRRHARLVWGVCRRALGHEQDSEDVFQATFLLLARQAGRIRKPESLASWLHGTALRMARRAKRDMARRHQREHRAARPGRVEGPPEPALRELQAMLDEEVRRLPEKYRAAFTTCALEGRGREEAAAVLGCEPGTVAVHLARARQRLQRQLARRGVTLAGALTAAALADTVRAAPSPVVSATLQAIREPAVAVSARVAALVQGAAGATKKKMLGILLVTGGLLTFCAGTWAALLQQPAAAAPVANRRLPAEPAEKDEVSNVSGRVIDPDGKAMAGVKVVFPVSRGEADPELKVIATTDAEGRFKGTVPAAKPGTWDERTLVAHVAGFGPAWIDLKGWAPDREVVLQLARADVVIKGRVLTLEGKPVAGATLHVSHIAAPNGDNLSQLFKLWPGDADRALREVPRRLYSPTVAGIPRKLTTDGEGRFEIKGVGDNRLLSLSVEADTIEHLVFRVSTAPDFDPKLISPVGKPPRPEWMSGGPPLYGPVFDHVARPTQIVTGVVRDQKTGKPMANVGVTGHVNKGWWENGVFAKTDAEGRYRLVGLPKTTGCKLTFLHADEGAPYLGLVRSIGEADGLKPIVADAEMVRGVVITGRVTDRETGQPITGGVRYVPLSGNKEVLKLPGTDIHSDGSMSYSLDDHGRFRLVAPPGLGVVLAQAETRVVDAKPYIQARLSAEDKKKPYFQVHEGLGEIFISAARHFEPLSGLNAYHVIEPAEGTEALTVNFELDPGKKLTGRLEDADGKPVLGATVTGLTSVWDEAKKHEAAAFTAVALEPKEPRTVAAIHAERKLAGAARLRGDEKAPAVVKMAPWAAVTGQVLDGAGKPVVGVSVRIRFGDATVSHAYQAARPNSPAVVTDKDGRFRVDIPFGGEEFRLSVLQGGKSLDIGKDYERVKADSGAVKDLGRVTVKAGEP